MTGFDALVAAVQANCNLSDARHARNMTLCTYLLEMREHYRWEQGMPLTASLPRAEVGAWIAGREALWSDLEDAEYRPLPLGGALVDPFDATVLNRELLPRKLVYGAGIGRFGKPQFFLGELEREEARDGVRILVARREFARDLSPAPAALRDGTIYVRLESLQRVLAERAEAWERKRTDGALKSVLVAHGFERDPEAALESMAAAEAETLILHELGEHAAARQLSPAWERMLAAFTRRRRSFSRARPATTWPIARRRCRRCWSATRKRRCISGSRDSTACAVSSSRASSAPTTRGVVAIVAYHCPRRSPQALRIGATSARARSSCTKGTTTIGRWRSRRSPPNPSIGCDRSPRQRRRPAWPSCRQHPRRYAARTTSAISVFVPLSEFVTRQRCSERSTSWRPLAASAEGGMVSVAWIV
jgi:hypothetical protein